MPRIRLEHVSKEYKLGKRKQDAVTDLNLTIEQGEFVFIVGSSGAGKSTLLSLLSGLTSPDKGTVYLDNLNINTVPSKYLPKVRRTFGQVQQVPCLMRKRTVRDNLMIVARSGSPLSKEKISSRVDNVLGVVGMAKDAKKFPVELSGGECRLVEFARALINNPSILVLDEMTANLDEDTIWDVFQILNDVHRHGTTVVMATHASMFVNIMRHRVITLVDGKVVGDVKRGKYGVITPEYPML